MKIIFNNYYTNGEGLILSTERLNYDLRMREYDKDHRALIISALCEFGKRNVAAFEECRFNTFESIGFTDEELSDLGYEYLIFSDE